MPQPTSSNVAPGLPAMMRPHQVGGIGGPGPVVAAGVRAESLGDLPVRCDAALAGDGGRAAGVSRAADGRVVMCPL